MTILANSDIHSPIEMNNEPEETQRPITLAFATERKAESIRYALENKKTAVYFDNKLIGKQQFLLPIFNESIKITSNFIQLGNNVS